MILPLLLSLSTCTAIDGDTLRCDQIGRMREGNLPWAEVIDPDPPTYEAFLDLVRVRFRINGIDQIGAPAWEPKLV